MCVAIYLEDPIAQVIFFIYDTLDGTTSVIIIDITFLSEYVDQNNDLEATH